jgi:4-amino-4-deoxy-L-arabinose transferase-like glycosyltransferase
MAVTGTAERAVRGIGRERPTPRSARLAPGLVAAVLVVFAWAAPVWEARLSAPQYPQGLRLTAYADRVEGDVEEVNELNHYVGMRAFTIEDVPERALWPLAIAGGLVAVAMGTFLPGRWGRLGRLGMWLVPLGALADVQFRLYQYGQTVDPTAAIRLDPFVPLVVGPTKVVNFTTWAYPGLAVFLFLAAAAVLTWGPAVVRRLLSPPPPAPAEP